MRGVAGEQDRARTKRAGDGRVHGPGADRQDLGFDPRRTDGAADPVETTLLRVRRESRGAPVVGDLTQPAAAPVERLEHAARVVAGHEVEDGGAIGGPAREIGAEVHVDEVTDIGRPFHRDAEPASHRARPAVAPQQKPALDLEHRAVVATADPRPHAVILDRHVFELVVEAQLARSQPLGEPADHRLVDVLRRQHADHRRQRRRAPAFEARGLHAAELAAGERRRVDEAAGPRVRQRSVEELGVDSPRPQDLHRAQVEVARLGMEGGAGMTLDQEAANAEPRETDRGDQSHGAATDDEHWNLH